MKVGIAFSNIMEFGTPAGARALGEAADESGIDSLWTVEHVVVPKDYASRYPYSRSGRMPGPEESPIPDPLVWISYVAAVTTRVRLATGILILPQRSPVILAKECASIDVLSQGRFVLGVGIGWLREEFEAIGVPFEERAARTDEAIQALRALWSDDESFNGDHYRFSSARSYPKPTRGRIPIVVGGHSPAAARRAGRLGDGFFPSAPDRSQLPGLFDECRRAAAEAGRNTGEIELIGSGGHSVQEAKRLADAGATTIVVAPPAFTAADIPAALGRLGEEFVSKIASL
ncbi:MAG TPA: LLM class F420-dependent oxidoreductase [Actinomycetota bacterium]|nr:LLM class F420-dependent oxidoreductase [Actinomycetota bacterium]